MDPAAPNWNIGPKYQILRTLGKGTYGSVCEARDSLRGEKVAIKSVNALFEDSVEAKHMLREISIMRTLDHPNIIKVHDILIPPDSTEFNSMYIAMEYAESDLKKLVKSATFLDRNQIRFLMYQAICGCRYMHSANILHRDLKPANILINSNCSLKICDFGLSRSYRRLNQFQDQAASLNAMDVDQGNSPSFREGVRRVLTGHVVTRWYRAPEVILLEKEYGKKMDIWSLGCVLAEMLGMMRENANSAAERSPLFPGRSCFPLSPDLRTNSTRAGYPCSERDQLSMIFDVIGTPVVQDTQFITDEKALNYVRSFPHIPARDLRDFYPACTPDELDLLSKFLTFSPEKRIALEEALEHPYFAAVKTPSLERLAAAPADFIFDRDQELNLTELRELFRAEVKRYELCN